MLPPPRPGRAAWEEAAAAGGRRAGGRRARPVGSGGICSFHARSQRLPLKPNPPARPCRRRRCRRPCPCPPRPGDRVAGAGWPGAVLPRARGRGRGPAGQVRTRVKPPQSHGPSRRPLWSRKLGAGEDLAQGEKSPRGKGERKRPHPRLPCASPPRPRAWETSGAGRGLCPPTAGSEVSPGQGDGPLKNQPFSSSPARWPGRCPPPALHKCKPGRNAEG